MLFVRLEMILTSWHECHGNIRLSSFFFCFFFKDCFGSVSIWSTQLGLSLADGLRICWRSLISFFFIILSTLINAPPVPVAEKHPRATIIMFNVDTVLFCTPGNCGFYLIFFCLLNFLLPFCSGQPPEVHRLWQCCRPAGGSGAAGRRQRRYWVLSWWRFRHWGVQISKAIVSYQTHCPIIMAKIYCVKMRIRAILHAIIIHKTFYTLLLIIEWCRRSLWQGIWPYHIVLNSMSSYSNWNVI